MAPPLRDVTTIGRVGVDLYSLDFNTPLKDVGRFAKYVGGGAANIVVGLAKLGLEVAIISGVSDDELGEFVTEYLSREGVETKYIIKSPEGKIGVVFAEVFAGKDSKFIFYRENATDLQIRREDVDNDAVSDSKIIVTTGTGLSANPSRESTLYAMELARKNGRTVVFNLDWRPSLWKGVDPVSRLEYYARGIELATMPIGNDKEYMAATGAEDIDRAISKIPDRKNKLLILTRGEHGSRAYLGDGKIVDAAPFKVDSMRLSAPATETLRGFSTVT